MNYPIPAKIYSSASEMLAEGKARRERLMSGRAAVEKRVAQLAPPPTEPQPTFVETLGAPVNMIAPPSWRFLLAVVALRHGLLPSDLLGTCRSQNIVAARSEAMLLVYQHTQASTTQVGVWFCKDHTTVLHALRKFPGYCKLVEKTPEPQSPPRAAQPGRDTFGRFLLGRRKPKSEQEKPRAEKTKKVATVLQRAVVRAYKHNVMPSVVAEEYGCNPKSVKVIAFHMGLKRSDYRAKDKTDWVAQP